jgi:hypothetical protein
VNDEVCEGIEFGIFRLSEGRDLLTGVNPTYRIYHAQIEHPMAGAQHLVAYHLDNTGSYQRILLPDMVPYAQYRLFVTHQPSLYHPPDSTA